MKLRWLGTAGFEFQTNGLSFLVDPFLSRNKTASPVQNLTPFNLEKTRHIFLSHGHFDHIMDVPQIAALSNCEIYCSDSVQTILKKHHTKTEQIKTVRTDQTFIDFQAYQAKTFFSKHIQFDKKLILSTLVRSNIQLLKKLALFRSFPCGQTLSWRFFVENKIIHFFGSAGSTDTELNKIKNEPPIDILLLPLQGHSDIFGIGINYIRYLKPKIVIVQHHDNFYPPISQSIQTQFFVKKVKKTFKDIQIIVPQINKPLNF